MITIYNAHKVLKEGTQEEVAQLQSQVSAIDAQLQRATQPLMARKNRLTVMLAQKQKQLSMQPQQPSVTPQPDINSQQQ